MTKLSSSGVIAASGYSTVSITLNGGGGPAGQQNAYLSVSKN